MGISVISTDPYTWEQSGHSDTKLTYPLSVVTVPIIFGVVVFLSIVTWSNLPLSPPAPTRTVVIVIK